MKRTAEKALSIISAVFTGISIAFCFIGLGLFNMAQSDPAFQNEIEMSLASDSMMGVEETALVLGLIDMFGTLIWIIIIGLFISLILTIIGIVSIWKNKSPKLAGLLFIVGGLFAGFLSITSILLYIAGILCLTRKPPFSEDSLNGESSFTNDNYEDAMRPL